MINSRYLHLFWHLVPVFFVSRCVNSFWVCSFVYSDLSIYEKHVKSIFIFDNLLKGIHTLLHSKCFQFQHISFFPDITFCHVCLG